MKNLSSKIVPLVTAGALSLGLTGVAHAESKDKLNEHNDTSTCVLLDSHSLADTTRDLVGGVIFRRHGNTLTIQMVPEGKRFAAAPENKLIAVSIDNAPPITPEQMDGNMYNTLRSEFHELLVDYEKYCPED